MKKGEIYYVVSDKKATGSEIWSNRPAVIVSSDVICDHANAVNVVYLTTANKCPMKTHVSVVCAGKSSTALCEQVHTVDKSRIAGYMGKISEAEMSHIEEALCFAMGIPSDDALRHELENTKTMLNHTKRELKAAKYEKLC